MNTSTSPARPTGFMVLHGNRLEDLRDLLVQYIAAHPLPVLQSEVILLQSNGMKHWLELALADEAALGICTATRMELPIGYLWQMYRAVLGFDAVPATMPFDKTALLWRLLRLLPVLCAANLVYAPLQRYLAGDNPARKLYQLAMQVADVLDGYQSYRSDWLADWALGRDMLRGPLGTAQPLPPEHAWQAQLWRDIRADIGSDQADASRASVHERFVRALAARQARQNTQASRRGLPGLPTRLIVFGISSLSMQAVQALVSLGQFCQVLMLVQNPCQYYWGDIVEGHAALRQQVRRRQQAKPAWFQPSTLQPYHRRNHQPDLLSEAAATHPLLASWGKQGRDYLHLLDGFDQPEAYRAHWSRVDVFVDPLAVTTSQLAQLQSAILNLTPTPPKPLAQPDDGSLLFVTAHSAQRELEVLHDRLLAWFEADPTLQPRDVIVMVPDMPAFAPHIHAVFGRFTPGQPRHIPFSVADTTARQTPLVQALAQLLSLPQSRLSLADWLALFEVAAVRARFALNEADVQHIQTWLAAAGVRWGLDGAHRRDWGLPAEAADVAHNTWAFGLRRLLLGYALGNTAEAGSAAQESEAGGLWQNTLAQPALSGLDAPLAAGLLGWLEAIELTLPALQISQTPAQWVPTLQALVARFFASTDEADERAIARLLEPLAVWQQACEDAEMAAELPLEVVREHWLAHISEPSLQQRFFGGGVQFGTLMPMRAIPFKLICLLGMNDGDYPRVQAPRDFDLMASTWRAGDRSRREDDRYLFLEALLSARHKLYISWQGHSAADNSIRPPSVLVAQLLDHVNACWSPAHQPQPQPLQPFSKVYFEEGSGFETFDADWQHLSDPPKTGAETGQFMPNQAVAPVLYAQEATNNIANQTTLAGLRPLPNAISLMDLQRLLRQPVEVFYRQRLQVEFDALDELEQEDEPFALNHLQQFNAGAVLLQAADPQHAMQELHAAGRLPLAGFGQKTAADLQDKAQTVRQAQAGWLQRYPQALAALPVDLLLTLSMPTTADASDAATPAAPAVMSLSGTLNGLWGPSDAETDTDAATAPCMQLAARIGAVLEGAAGAQSGRAHVLAGLWVRHLAGCAMGLRLTSVQLGIDGQVLLLPLAPEQARARLQQLVQVWCAAWAQPLPLACKTGWSYLLAQQHNLALTAAGKPQKDPLDAAQAVFEGGQYGGEVAESAYLRRAFATFESLSAGLPHWAGALYGDLLAHIELSRAASPDVRPDL